MSNGIGRFTYTGWLILISALAGLVLGTLYRLMN